MRIHEILEACLEYVAVDGTLGCDPTTLQQHLAGLDPSQDFESFAYIWSLLVQHPVIQVIITTYPLYASADQLTLGTAPLPADFKVPEDDAVSNVDMNALLRGGARGREIVSHLAGERHMTSKEAVADKRQEKERIRREKDAAAKKAATGRADVNEIRAGPSGTGNNKRSEAEDGEVELLRVLEEDDGQLGDGPVEKFDLLGLMAKWGSRLRIRCTETEIYFRLTGSHQKRPGISAVVLHTLQLAARAREKGITAVELGPIVGASQGSLHYYLKVLIGMGLVAKVPTIIHGSATSVVLFHKFLQQNEAFRSLRIADDILKPEPSADKGKQKAEDTGADDDELKELIDPELGSQSKAGTPFTVSFDPLSESDLMAGHVVRERLIKLLDQPGLINHLLRVYNLLVLLGWRGKFATRHQRAVRRQINNLAAEGVLEILDVGETRVRCIRLTKYNSDFVPNAVRASADAVDVDAEDEGGIDEDGQAEILENLIEFQRKIDFNNGVPITLPEEHVVVRAIVRSETEGLTFAGIRDNVGNLFKRYIDFLMSRLEECYVPPHIRGMAICSVMESAGKERRLRIFGVESYRNLLSQQGVTPDDSKHPPHGPEVGKWAVTPKRQYFKNWSDIQTWINRYDGLYDPKDTYIPRKAAKPQGRPRKPNNAKLQKLKNIKMQPHIGATLPSSSPAVKVEGEENAEAVAIAGGRPTKSGRQSLYPNEVQVKGRPRKYVYVVNEEGKVQRHVIGEILPNSELPLILIWIKSKNLLVPGPPGYTGLGAPPPVDEVQLSQGKPPEYFAKYPGGARQKAKKGKRKREDTGSAPPTPKKPKATKAGTAKPAKGKMQTFSKEDRDVYVTNGIISRSPTPEIEVIEKPVEVQQPVLSTVSHSDDVQPPSEVIDLTDEPIVVEAPVVVVDDEPIQQRRQPQPPEAMAAEVTQQTTRKRKKSSPPATSDNSGALHEDNTPDTSASTSSKPKPQEVSDGSTDLAVTTAPPEPITPVDVAHAEVIVIDDPMDGLPDDTVESTSSKTVDDAFQIQPSEAPSAHAPLIQDIAPEPAVAIISESDQAQINQNPQPSKASEEQIDTPMKPALERHASATPLREIAMPPPSAPYIKKRVPPTVKHLPDSIRQNGRVDLGFVRKTNELCQVLREIGGVSSDNALNKAHTDWTYRVAGTDATFAPLAGYTMDRHVFRKTLASILNDGRAKETKASIPTNTGRWIQNNIIYLTDTPKEDLQAYIRNLSQVTMDSAYGYGRKSVGTHIPDSGFTSVQIKTKPLAVKEVENGATPTEMTEDQRIEAKREAYMKEQYASAYLLGFQSGRWKRMELLHKAIIDAMANNPQSSSNLSNSPRVFSIMLLFEDLTIKEWYSCILAMRHDYDPELEEWLRDPVKSKTRIRDLPKRLHPRDGFRGGRARSKFSALLSVLCELKILTPLTPAVIAEEASIRCKRRGSDEDLLFDTFHDANVAMFFQVHDYTPVYHIAIDESPLLGVMPVRTMEEAKSYWEIVRKACLNPDDDHLPTLVDKDSSEVQHVAPVGDKLAIGDHLQGLLRSGLRWRHKIRLQPDQRVALNDAIDWRTGKRIVKDPEEVRKLAYRLALPREFVEEHLAVKTLHARERISKRKEKEREEQALFIERQNRSRDALRQKLEERRIEAKAAWEQRIQDSAIRVGVTYTQELADFVRKQTLQGSDRTRLNDERLDQSVLLFSRSKEMGFAIPRIHGRMPGFPAPPLATSRPKAATKKPAPRFSLPQEDDEPRKPGTRYRKSWKPDDDEAIIDAEAIILCRAAGRKALGRHAMLQLFPKVGSSSLLHRVKKLLGMPGKQAYFDQLAAKWNEIWHKHRGTPELPDENPDSVVDFDLRKHIEFLREHVDKGMLKMMARPVAPGVQAHAPPPPDLPYDIELLLKDYAVKEVVTKKQSFFDVLDQAAADDNKSKALAEIPLRDEEVETPTSDVTRSSGVLAACMKMIVATSNETYSQTPAIMMLKPWDVTKHAMANHKLVQDQVFIPHRVASMTGRFFTFRQEWLKASDGPFPSDLYNEASEIAAKLEDPEGMEWPLIGQPGYTADLLQLISDHEVDFDVDVDMFPVLLYKRYSYNTRAMNDDLFETTMRVKRVCNESDHKTPLPDARASPRLIAWPNTSAEDHSSQNFVDTLIGIVKAAGEGGVSKSDLQDALVCTPESLDTALAIISTQTSPSVFWAGYDTARLVHSDFIDSWKAVSRPRELDERGRFIVKQGTEYKIWPRRWFDIYGVLQEEDWKRLHRCIAGHIQVKPGITETALRKVLETVLDRIEFNEVAQDLLSRGVLRRAWMDADETRVLPPVQAMDLEEESDVAWWVVAGKGLA